MTHPPRHSRPKARQTEDQHALGSLHETLNSPIDDVPLETCLSQFARTAPPSSLSPAGDEQRAGCAYDDQSCALHNATSVNGVTNGLWFTEGMDILLQWMGDVRREFIRRTLPTEYNTQRNIRMQLRRGDDRGGSYPLGRGFIRYGGGDLPGAVGDVLAIRQNIETNLGLEYRHGYPVRRYGVPHGLITKVDQAAYAENDRLRARRQAAKARQARFTFD